MIIVPRVKEAPKRSFPIELFRFYTDGTEISRVLKKAQFDLNWTQERFNSHISHLFPLWLVREKHREFALVLLNVDGSYTWDFVRYDELLSEWRTWHRCCTDINITDSSSSKTMPYGFWEWTKHDGIRENSRNNALMLSYAKGAYPPKFAVITDYLDSALAGKTIEEING